MTDQTLKTTPLNAAHRALGARMVPFAGYDMPVQYEGVLAEHRWTREHAGLFDVSHMGQCKITGEDAVAQFERFVPGDYEILKAGRQKYSLLLNDQGGIMDDLMAGKPDHDGLFIVVNAACKDADFAHIEAGLEGDAKLTRLDRALLAIQGPEAAEVMAAHEPVLADFGFMDSARLMLFGADCFVSRSGYTGEDGYEISVPADQAERIWNTILEDARVKPIGLGARDSLRLEAGLPLYGHDADGKVIGKVTSGGPSPSLGKNIAMGYVPPEFSEIGTALTVIVRSKPLAAEVVATPFVANRYYRKPKS